MRWDNRRMLSASNTCLLLIQRQLLWAKVLLQVIRCKHGAPAPIKPLKHRADGSEVSHLFTVQDCNTIRTCGYKTLFHAQLSWEWNMSCLQKIRYQQFKLISCKAELSMKFLLLINIKMPTIVAILIFISRRNFMLNWVKYEKKKKKQLLWPLSKE